ncbi:MAG: hypothetical protein IE933_06045 [Sphingomonadales bacterium]|nr:hypothetical protein [Sphingomonadales bacterium]MBD3773741.1 hypothetical protein [Paracoccaceae bacterium]
MKLFALAFGAMVLIGAALFVDNRAATDEAAEQQAAKPQTARQAAAPAPRPAVQSDNSATNFSSDEDLVDEAGGDDTSGFEPNPMIDADAGSAQEGEVAILPGPTADQANTSPAPPGGPSQGTRESTGGI